MTTENAGTCDACGAAEDNPVWTGLCYECNETACARERDRSALTAEVIGLRLRAEKAEGLVAAIETEADPANTQRSLVELRGNVDALTIAVVDITAERDALEAELLAIADAVGYVNRAEGQGGYERMSGQELAQRWRDLERAWNRAGDERDAALAQVAALLEAIREHSECSTECERCGHYGQPCADDDVCRPLNDAALVDAAKDFEARVRREAIEEAARVVEGGRFLHDDAPAARFGRECAKAVRALAEKEGGG